MADPQNPGGPTERELFAIAAEHFTDAELDEQAMDEVWQLLEESPHTAAEIADTLDEDPGELEAFLAWSHEQGMVETEQLKGDVFYSRYNLTGEKLAAHTERTRSGLTGWLETTDFKLTKAGMLVFGVASVFAAMWLSREFPGIMPDSEFVVVLGAVLVGMFVGTAVVVGFSVYVPRALAAIRDKLSRTKGDE